MSCADAAHPPEAGGELDLGADAVGRGDEHRVVHRRDRLGREHPAEAADAADDLGAVGALDGRRASGRRPGCPRRCRRRRRRTTSASRPAPASRCRGAPASRRTGRRPSPRRRRARAAARSAPSPVTASTRPPVDDAVGHPGREQQCPRFCGVLIALSATDSRQNRAAEDRGGGVAGGGGDDGAGRAAGDHDLDLGDARSPRVHASASSARSERSSGSTAWASGSPKRTLYSTRRGPAGGQHQPGVEHADVRRAGGGEVVEHRLHERGHQLVAGVRHRRRGVGAHPAGVRRRCRPRRCACGPGPAAAPAPCGRRTAPSSEHSGPLIRSSSTNGPAGAADRGLGLGVAAPGRSRPCRRPARRA